MNETNSFTSSVTKEEFKINHCFNCNEKCLIYLLTCKVCLKQYVGQTVDEFRLRWNFIRAITENTNVWNHAWGASLWTFQWGQTSRIFRRRLNHIHWQKRHFRTLKKRKWLENKTIASLGLNNEDSLWETFQGITDGMILDKIYGLRCCYFLYILFTILLKKPLESVSQGLVFSFSMQWFYWNVYWKRDAILAPLW